MTTTNPVIQSSNGGPTVTARTATTTPAAGLPARAAAPDAVAAVVSAVATQYWMELVPLPPGPMQLWFFADNGWRALTNPTAIQCDMVQRAFLGSGSTVTVWYDGGTVVGLVVSG